MSQRTSPFSEQLSFEDLLPLTVERLSDAPSPNEILRFDERNLSLLKTLTADDVQRREPEPSLEALMVEIDRLEQKLNLVTELLADLVRREIVVPPPRTFRLSSAGVSFSPLEHERAAAGDWLKLSLFLLPNVPRPLQFGARVVEDDSGLVSSDWVTVCFEDVHDAVESALDRLVFKHHRREVALKRAKRDGGEA